MTALLVNNIRNAWYSNYADILQKVKILTNMLNFISVMQIRASVEANRSRELSVFGIFVIFTEDTWFSFFRCRNSMEEVFEEKE